VKGFCHQASAAGLTALVERDPRSAASDRPRHRVLIAPSRGPDQESIRDLTSYVEGGGTLWLVAGYEQAAPLASLSRALGAEILPAPLGGSGVDSGAGADSIARQAAWAVKTEEPATTLASACGFPFAATLTRGQGRVVVVGDSYFLCDQNLEGGRTEVAPNVALVGRLLGDGER
jgi:hypothetical protein